MTREHLIMEVGSARRIGWLLCDFDKLEKHPDPTIGIVYYISGMGMNDVPLSYERHRKDKGRAPVLWCRPADVDILMGVLLHFRPCAPPRHRRTSAKDKYRRLMGRKKRAA